jgi:hypothetical protein
VSKKRDTVRRMEPKSGVRARSSYWMHMDRAERTVINDALAAKDFAVRDAAELLGITRAILAKRIRILGIALPPRNRRGEHARRIAAKEESGARDPSAALQASGHDLTAPGGPTCVCGAPSRHESGWCGTCGTSQCSIRDIDP